MSATWVRIGIVLMACAAAAAGRAQPLNLDGATGGQLTPWALVAPSKKGEAGHAVVAHHYLDGGPIVGDVNNACVALGVDEQFEFSFAHYFIDGPTPAISSDLDVLSAKWNFVKAKGERPAIAVGAHHRMSGARNLDTTDIYVVATRIFGLKNGRAILLNGGLRSTQAAIYGIAGRAADRELEPFGTFGYVIDSHFTVGVEAIGQPGNDVGRSYFVRWIPMKKDNLQIIVAHSPVENAIGADGQFTSNVSYRF